MRKKRIDKKYHKFWLPDVRIDASQSPYWRKILFNGEYNEPFTIDKEHLEGISIWTAKAIKRYELRYRVAKVLPEMADEAWLSEGGLAIFKFWCADYPTLCLFSGNNPQTHCPTLIRPQSE